MFHIGQLIRGTPCSGDIYPITNSNSVLRVTGIDPVEGLNVKVLECPDFPGSVGRTFTGLKPEYFEIIPGNNTKPELSPDLQEAEDLLLGNIRSSLEEEYAEEEECEEDYWDEESCEEEEEDFIYEGDIVIGALPDFGNSLISQCMTGKISAINLNDGTYEVEVLNHPNPEMIGVTIPGVRHSEIVKKENESLGEFPPFGTTVYSINILSNLLRTKLI